MNDEVDAMRYQNIFTGLISTMLILTAIGCTPKKAGISARIESEAKDLPPLPPPARTLAPETASVSARIISSTEEENSFHCLFRIEQTYGYGSATPPLPKGGEIHVGIPKILLKKNEQSHSRLLKVGNTLEMILHAPSPTAQKEKTPLWQALKIY